MMENFLWILAGITYTCAAAAYFKWKLDDIVKTSDNKPQKQNIAEQPCYDCL